MRHVTRPLGVLLLITMIACARTAPVETAAPRGPSVWTADFMHTKPGQLDRYLRYLDANWARSRRTILAQGHIRSFRVLVTTPTDDAPWDVVLLTEYPDSATYARAEEIFGPVMAAQGQTLIDGLSGSGPDNPLKRTVASSVFRTAIDD